jgi:Holliday junction resolvasome RuvABC endonuclease subunit
MHDVIGVDLSFSATGIAWPEGQDIFCTSEKDGEHHERASIIASHVGHFADHSDLVVIEAGVYMSRSAFTLGILHGIVYKRIESQQVLRVTPSQLKQYAAGSGKATKTEMVVNARERLGYTGFDDNEADAVWLRAIGHAMLGEALVDLPAKNKKALTKLDLPSSLA